MKRLQGNLQDIHNIGLIDRAFRFFAGGALLFVGVIAIVVSEKAQVWEVVVILLAIYPLMTCIMGWDPVYQIAGIRTGTDTSRNVTGTFPFQVDAALGNNPVPDKNYEYDHSMSGSHHEPNEKVKIRKVG